MALAAKEERIIRLKRTKPSAKMHWKYANHAHIGTEGIADIAPYEGFKHDVSIYGIKTDHLELIIDQNVGITSIIDRQTGAELLHPARDHAPFVGVHEVTSFKESNPYSVRSIMGRNRKTPSTDRTVAKLVNVKQLEDGPLYAVLLLKYELAGTGM